MALITCPECGTEVSDKALTCPKCGYTKTTSLVSQSSVKNEKDENTGYSCENQYLERYKVNLEFLKFEATTLWQIFSAFFVAHAIFIGFIASSFSGSKHHQISCAFLIMACIVGILMAILWLGTFIRNSDWYDFRMWQAKKAENEFKEHSNIRELYLLNGDAEAFSNGSKVEIRIDKQKAPKILKMCLIGRWNKIGGRIMIIIFLLVYLLIILLCSLGIIGKY
jgi:hypothetical protein